MPRPCSCWDKWSKPLDYCGDIGRPLGSHCFWLVWLSFDNYLKRLASVDPGEAVSVDLLIEQSQGVLSGQPPSGPTSLQPFLQTLVEARARRLQGESERSRLRQELQRQRLRHEAFFEKGPAALMVGPRLVSERAGELMGPDELEACYQAARAGAHIWKNYFLDTRPLDDGVLVSISDKDPALASAMAQLQRLESHNLRNRLQELGKLAPLADGPLSKPRQRLLEALAGLLEFSAPSTSWRELVGTFEERA